MVSLDVILFKIPHTSLAVLSLGILLCGFVLGIIFSPAIASRLKLKKETPSAKASNKSSEAK